MILYGYRYTWTDRRDGDTVIHYLSDDEGWIYDQMKETRRNWDPADLPILIEAFEAEVNLSEIETEEYFRGERTGDDIWRDIEDVEKRIEDLKAKKADLLRESVS